MREILSMAGSLILIVLVLVLTYYATRWYARRYSQQGHSGKYIKVLDRSVLGSGASVAIVQIGERFYMLGVGDKQVSLLSELPEFEIPPDGPDEPVASINQTFRQLLDKARGGSGKDGDHRP